MLCKRRNRTINQFDQAAKDTSLRHIKSRTIGIRQLQPRPRPNLVLAAFLQVVDPTDYFAFSRQLDDFRDSRKTEGTPKFRLPITATK